MTIEKFEELLKRHGISYNYDYSCFRPTLEKDGVRLTCRFDIGNLVPIEEDINKFLDMIEHYSNHNNSSKKES